MAAGTHTTADAMAKMLFHMLSDPNRFKRLKSELESAIPDANSTPLVCQVENLPYLVSSLVIAPLVSKKSLQYAVIQETIRLHSAGSMRQERIAPDEDLFYTSKDGKTYRIPAGVSTLFDYSMKTITYKDAQTTMAMTAPLLARNADLYPSPHSFHPERFLENPHLDKHSLAFSRGPRICLGVGTFQ
jgi:cytochrome P450